MSNYIYLILRADKNRHPSIFIAISEILPYIAREMECAFYVILRCDHSSYLLSHHCFRPNQSALPLSNQNLTTTLWLRETYFVFLSTIKRPYIVRYDQETLYTPAHAPVLTTRRCYASPLQSVKSVKSEPEYAQRPNLMAT